MEHTHSVKQPFASAPIMQLADAVAVEGCGDGERLHQDSGLGAQFIYLHKVNDVEGNSCAFNRCKYSYKYSLYVHVCVHPQCQCTRCLRLYAVRILNVPPFRLPKFVVVSRCCCCLCIVCRYDIEQIALLSALTNQGRYTQYDCMLKMML